MLCGDALHARDGQPTFLDGLIGPERRSSAATRAPLSGGALLGADAVHYHRSGAIFVGEARGPLTIAVLLDRPPGGGEAQRTDAPGERAAAMTGGESGPPS